MFPTLQPKLKSFVLYEKVNVFGGQDKSYKTFKEATVREAAVKLTDEWEPKLTSVSRSAAN